jgi:hypothetical protein
MKPKRFTTDDVCRLVGRNVRSLIQLSVIPKGASGRIVAAQEMEPGSFDLIVEWDRAPAGSPDRDYFNRDEFERCLIEA